MLILLLVLNCRSRKKALQINEYRTAEVERIDTDTMETLMQQEQKKVSVKKTEQEKLKENDGDIIIKGKTDTGNDFHFHNVVDGDTLSDITISGTAILR